MIGNILKGLDYIPWGFIFYFMYVGLQPYGISTEFVKFTRLFLSKNKNHPTFCCKEGDTWQLL